jgi:hypothetical protein
MVNAFIKPWSTIASNHGPTSPNTIVKHHPTPWSVAILAQGATSGRRMGQAGREHFYVDDVPRSLESLKNTSAKTSQKQSLKTQVRKQVRKQV